MSGLREGAAGQLQKAYDAAVAGYDNDEACAILSESDLLQI